MNTAWLAGFFDGDGHVTVVAKTVGQSNRRPVVGVGLSQSDRTVLDEVAVIYGGAVNQKSATALSARPVFEWTSRAQSVAHRFLTDIRPYLRIKAVDVDRALGLIGEPYQPTACRRHHPFTPENTVYRANGKRRCRTCSRERAGAVNPRGPYRRSPEHLQAQADLIAARPTRSRRYPEETR